MKRESIWMKALCAMAFCSCFLPLGGQDAPKKSVYDHYLDWQLQGVVIQDENAASNVRLQTDFTKPLHGPWLTNPRPDGMTITWITRIPCAGGIDYREKGTDDFVRLWPVSYGRVDYSKDIHFFHLTGLKPGTEYEYRLVSNLDQYTSPYQDIVAGRELYSFRTIDPEKKEYRVFITSDFHGGSRLILDPLIDRTEGAADSDLFFFLGDNLEDGNYNNIRYYITYGFLDDITRRWGSFKPTIFIRGNHDLNGPDVYRYGDYFPSPEETTYQAIRQGSTLFICLDTL